MLKIGSVVDGKYKILYRVGKGGMSYVYLAINEVANKEWAIKEIRKDARVDGEAVKQSPITETNIMKKLSNPHLPRIIDVINEEDAYLIVMDYIEGVTLKSRLDNEGRQNQEDVVDWALQLCEVLGYLHSQDPPIIYRDMKPGNIMLRPDGRIMLIDFGIAREYKDGAAEDTKCLGTKGYAAPEQYGGQGQTDERTDIYNLGATIYHLVTGKDPTKPPYEMRPIRTWDPAFSSGLETIIVKCTKNDPEERYQNIEELQFALKHYKELEEEYQQTKRGKWRLFKGLCAAAMVSLVLSAGMKIYAYTLTSGTYDAKIKEAETSTEQEKAVRAYEEAIRISPANKIAYSNLLNEVFLADGNYTQKEADRFTTILGYRGNRDSRTIEEKFQKNKSGYEEFCYEMGLAFFYFYEGFGNKPLSKPWLRTAKESGSLEEKKRMRAERLYHISEYYTQLGSMNRAGDNTANYLDYWNDLVKLSGDDIAQEDNIRTALVMYGELVYQIGAHASDFKKAGVTRADMLFELRRVERILTEEIVGDDTYSEDEYGQKVDEILRGTDIAQKEVDIVYPPQEGEGG